MDAWLDRETISIVIDNESRVNRVNRLDRSERWNEKIIPIPFAGYHSLIVGNVPLFFGLSNNPSSLFIDPSSVAFRLIATEVPASLLLVYSNILNEEKCNASSCIIHIFLVRQFDRS